MLAILLAGIESLPSGEIDLQREISPVSLFRYR